MRLTSYSDYSLRVLMYLAVKDGEKSTITEISETYDISKEHLRKVVHNLVKENYISSSRGRSGGLFLKKLPDQINLGDVIRHTETDLTIVECFDSDSNKCILKESCKLQHVLAKALKAFLAVLDEYTLNDLLLPQHPLRQSLGLAN